MILSICLSSTYFSTFVFVEWERRDLLVALKIFKSLTFAHGLFIYIHLVLLKENLYIFLAVINTPEIMVSQKLWSLW